VEGHLLGKGLKFEEGERLGREMGWGERRVWVGKGLREGVGLRSEISWGWAWVWEGRRVAEGEVLEREMDWSGRWAREVEGSGREKDLGEEDGFGDGHGLGRELG